MKTNIVEYTGYLSVNKNNDYFTTMFCEFDPVTRGSLMNYDVFKFDEELSIEELDVFATNYFEEELRRKDVKIDDVFFMPSDSIWAANTYGKPLYVFGEVEEDGSYRYEFETHFNFITCAGHDAVKASSLPNKEK